MIQHTAGTCDRSSLQDPRSGPRPSDRFHLPASHGISAGLIIIGILLGGCDAGSQRAPGNPHIRPPAVDLSQALKDAQEELATERSRAWEQAEELERYSTQIFQLQEKLNRTEADQQLTTQALARSANELAVLQTQLVAVQRILEGENRQLQQTEDQRAATQQQLDAANAMIETFLQHAELDKANIDALGLLNVELESALSRTEARASRMASNVVPTTTNPFSRRRFSVLVQGMAVSDVTAYLGAPDSVEGTAPARYVYARPLTYGADPSRPDQSVILIIENGLVTSCLFRE